MEVGVTQRHIICRLGSSFLISFSLHQAHERLSKFKYENTLEFIVLGHGKYVSSHSQNLCFLVVAAWNIALGNDSKCISGHSEKQESVIS